MLALYNCHVHVCLCEGYIIIHVYMWIGKENLGGGGGTNIILQRQLIRAVIHVQSCILV